MPGFIKDASGTWQNIQNLSINNGTWVDAEAAWINTGTSWEQFYSKTIPNLEESLGTPFATYSIQGEFIDELNGYAGPAFFAVDLQGFNSSTNGVIWEMGATALGSGAYLVPGGELRVTAGDGRPWQNSAASWLVADVSPYYNMNGTLYFFMGENQQTKAWWVEGGPLSGNSPILLATATNTFTGNSWGTSLGSFGRTNRNVPDFGLDEVDYTGTLNELRWWQTTPPSSFA